MILIVLRAFKHTTTKSSHFEWLLMGRLTVFELNGNSISVSPDKCITVTRVWKGFHMIRELTSKQSVNQTHCDA